MQQELLPHNGTPTSKAAAVAQGRKPEKVKADRDKILQYLKKCGERGATDAEMQAALVLGGNTQRPRRGELAKRGDVYKNGERRSGSAVWVAAPEKFASPADS